LRLGWQIGRFDTTFSERYGGQRTWNNKAWKECKEKGATFKAGNADFDFERVRGTLPERPEDLTAKGYEIVMGLAIGSGEKLDCIEEPFKRLSGTRGREGR
jgi:hypothetical protein